MMIWIYLKVIRDNRARKKLGKITKNEGEHEEKVQFTETNIRNM